jgi:hypothetical protein
MFKMIFISFNFLFIVFYPKNYILPLLSIFYSMIFLLSSFKDQLHLIYYAKKSSSA